MKKVQGFTRPQGLRERVQVLEGAVDALFQAHSQITQQLSNMAILVQALGAKAGGDEGLQPFIDQVVAKMNGAKPEEAPSAPVQED